MEFKVDDVSMQILGLLQQNARATFSDIGREIGLTSPAVAERIKKMEDGGIIQKYRTEVSHAALGFQLRAMITLRAFVGKLKPFLNSVGTFEEVVNCYRITGNENIIMEVVLRDQIHLERLIDRLIAYGETRTHIVLSNVISNATLPNTMEK